MEEKEITEYEEEMLLKRYDKMYPLCTFPREFKLAFMRIITHIEFMDSLDKEWRNKE